MTNTTSTTTMTTTRNNTTSTSSSSNSKSQMTESLEKKAEEINLVLLQPNVDLWRLRELALSEGGLVNDTLRKRAWPKLVGLHKYYHTPSLYTTKPAPAEPTTREGDDDEAQQQQEGGEDGESHPPPRPPPTPQFEIDTSMIIETPSSNHQQQHSSFSSSNHNHNNHTTNNHNIHDLLVTSMDAAQIDRDVARCTWHLLTGTQRSRRVQYQHKDKSKKVLNLLKKKQRRLANLINLTLVESYTLVGDDSDSDSAMDRLRYYQGYHDVACIFLHALGGSGSGTPQGPPSRNGTGATATSSSSSSSSPWLTMSSTMGLELPARVLCQVSHSHFRDHLQPNFCSLQTALKMTLFPLLYKLDREVHDHLQLCDMEPFFCLSWVLTWFAHDVRDTALVKRLFDAFLVSHPLFPLYVALAMMLHPTNRQLILSTDCDFAALHQCLVMLPRNSSKVGWKQRWDGSGYVSDDEDPNEQQQQQRRQNDEEDRTASTDLDDSSLQPWDMEDRSVPLSTVSRTSSSGWNSNTTHGSSTNRVGPVALQAESSLLDKKVPFQDLIDTGLQYMTLYPPRCLASLAQRYYQDEDDDDDIYEISNISLLQRPPSWSIAATSQADWVLKQRVRQGMGLSPTSRKDRRKRSMHPHAAALQQRSASSSLHNNNDNNTTTSDNDAKPIVHWEYLEWHKWNPAVIAAGYGPGPEEMAKRKRQRKRFQSAVWVGMMAVTVGLACQQYYYYCDYDSQTTALSTTSRRGLWHPGKVWETILLSKQQPQQPQQRSFDYGSFKTPNLLDLAPTQAVVVLEKMASLTVLEYCKHPLQYLFDGDKPKAWTDPVSSSLVVEPNRKSTSVPTTQSDSTLSVTTRTSPPPLSTSTTTTTTTTTTTSSQHTKATSSQARASSATVHSSTPKTTTTSVVGKRTSTSTVTPAHVQEHPQRGQEERPLVVALVQGVTMALYRILFGTIKLLFRPLRPLFRLLGGK